MMTKLPKKYASRHTYSHAFLRKLVGWLAILFPVILSLGGFFIFKGNLVEKSVSQYYHTGMRDFFVGTLFALAMFLFYDTGYNVWDDWMGNFAGFFAIGVGLFPPSVPECKIAWEGYVHFICAILLFVTLAIISLVLFPKIGKKMKSTFLTRRRKFIYRFCGITMFACLIAIGIYYLNCHPDCSASTFVFWGESIAMMAFGISWLTCGFVIPRIKK